MDESTLRIEIKAIASEVKGLLDVDTVDDRTHGSLQALANELDRLGDRLSDDKVKSTIHSVTTMVGGGVFGYAAGKLLDNLEYLVATL